MWESRLQSPSAPPHLRPADAYVAAQILPIIADYKTRPEWRILGETRARVVKAEKIAEAIQRDRR